MKHRESWERAQAMRDAVLKAIRSGGPRKWSLARLCGAVKADGRVVDRALQVLRRSRQIRYDTLRGWLPE